MKKDVLKLTLEILKLIGLTGFLVAMIAIIVK